MRRLDDDGEHNSSGCMTFVLLDVIIILSLIAIALIMKGDVLVL